MSQLRCWECRFLKYPWNYDWEELTLGRVRDKDADSFCKIKKEFRGGAELACHRFAVRGNLVK